MRKRIIITLLCLILTFTLGAVIISVSVRQTTAELRNLISLHQVETLRKGLVIHIQNMQSDLFTLNTPLAHSLDTIVENGVNLERAARGCMDCHHSPTVTERMKDIVGGIQRYHGALSRYMTASADEQMTFRLKMEAAAIGHDLLAMAEDMSMRASARLEGLTRHAVLRMDSVPTLLIATIMVTFIVSLLVFLHLTAWFRRPIQDLLRATSSIAGGNLGHTIRYDEPNEFGELAVNFNTMSKALKEGYLDLEQSNTRLRQEIEERKITAGQLSKSQRFLNSIFDSILDPLCVFDRNCLIVRVNRSFAALYGKDPKDLPGGACADFLSKGDADCEDCVAKKTFLSGDPCAREHRQVLPDGTIAWLEVFTYPIRDGEGEVSHVVEYARDVTERRKMEEERLRSQKMESIGILAGGIAHDFNNLLTAILGNISLAHLNADPGAGTGERLKDAEMACLRAKDLTLQLLTFSKTGVPSKRVASVRDLIEESARLAFSGSNARFEALFSEDPWPVEVDEGQMIQVFSNILINAIQAMPQGGTVHVNCENLHLSPGDSGPLAQTTFVRVGIRDEGTGIPVKHLDRIFDPYFTTKQRGSGLGLAVSYSIVRKHGGHIAVESSPGKGAVFSVCLPAYPGKEVSDKPPPQVRQELHLGKRRQGKGRVLVMDDDEIIREVSANILIASGYDVDCACHGEGAIESFVRSREEGNPYDVLILDLTVSGGLGGKETLIRLRAIDPQVKAIVSSGFAQDPVLVDFPHHGFSGAIAKPFTVDDLCSTVQDLLDSHPETADAGAVDPIDRG